MKTTALQTVIIGAGNVGYHLGCRFAEQGLPVIQVFSRSAEKANAAAAAIGTSGTHLWSDIRTDAGLYIIAVADDAIESVAKQLQAVIGRHKMVVHTSGTVPMTALRPSFDHYGSFYPLQTFSMARQPDFDQVPICISANTDAGADILRSVGNRISNQVYDVRDDQRAILHIAAVIANNFTNYLYQLAGQVLKGGDLPFGLLRPLIAETAQKVQVHLPETVQTGPAARGDKHVIEKHLSYLRMHHPEIGQVYEMLTNGIMKKD